jgi:hypothetical protein
MSYNRNVVHEGAIRDIVDLIVDGKLFDSIDNLIGRGGRYMKNISRETSNLVLTFPVIADESVSLSTARLMAKATERRVVGMLQMLFAAIDITNNTDAFEFIGKVHQNLTSDDVLSFINKMDARKLKHENLDIDAINKIMLQCIAEDTIELDNNLPNSLNNSIKIINNNVFIEANNPNTNTQKSRDQLIDDIKEKNKTIKKQEEEIERLKNRNKKTFEYGKSRVEKVKKYYEDEKNKRNRDTLSKIRDIEEKEEKLNELNKKINDPVKNRSQITDPKFLSDQILSSDLKKANDDVPSLLIVRFISGKGDVENKIVSQAIIGVKAKLVYVKQSDMVNRIITKNRDNNGLFNFLRATTGEISMIKDFLFAIDRAKLDTISTKNNSSPIWKLLERRYLVSKKNWLLRNSNGAGTAIAVLVISKETEDILNKEYGFKCEPYKMLDIMEAYSVMGFAIVDDVNERVKSLYDDNSTQYEVNSYSSYEKEDKAQFKKMINLMTGGKEKI